MDVLNKVRRRRRLEELLSHLHDVTNRVAASFCNTESFAYISSLHFFNDDAIVFGRNFSSHSCHSYFHNDSSMSTTSWLARSFPYISKICLYAFVALSSGTLIITVGIKSKSLEAEYGNLAN